VDLEQPKVLQRLLWAAQRAGRKIRYADTRTDTLDVEPVGPRAPLRPWDHPDLVLARAVLAAVIDADEANIIAATRLEGIPVEKVADRWGIPRQLASQWRKQAERRLTDAIRAGELSGVMLQQHDGESSSARRRNGLASAPPQAWRGVSAHRGQLPASGGR
jgi:hypothetical protein